jgi:YopX protein
MREIKFRLLLENQIVGYERWYPGVWDSGSESWRAIPCWLYSAVGELWAPGRLAHNYKEQWTGTYDKEGLEIYEGDIIKAVIVFDSGQLPHMGRVIWSNDFAEYSTSNDAGETPFFEHIPYTREIIGNIHKSPELLN